MFKVYAAIEKEFDHIPVANCVSVDSVFGRSIGIHTSGDTESRLSGSCGVLHIGHVDSHACGVRFVSRSMVDQVCDSFVSELSSSPTEYKEHCIDNIRFPRSVGADDCGEMLFDKSRNFDISLDEMGLQ